MSTVDTMTEDEIRNTAEFAEWIAQYNKLNHADLTTKTAPYYLFIDYLSTFITDDEIDKVDELTAENAKLREQLAEAVGLLESIGYFADIQVTDARDDILEGGTPDDHAERWERIATFLFKRGFYNTTE